MNAVPDPTDYDMLSNDLADMLDRYGYSQGEIAAEDIRPVIEPFMAALRAQAAGLATYPAAAPVVEPPRCGFCGWPTSDLHASQSGQVCTVCFESPAANLVEFPNLRTDTIAVMIQVSWTTNYLASKAGD